MQNETLTSERAAAVVRRLVEEVMNGGNLEVADEIVAPAHVNHDPSAPDFPRGPEGVKMVARMYRLAFPDMKLEVEEMFAAEGRVAHRWTLTGTQERRIMGISPTGQKVRVAGIEINHVEDGLITESWTVSDTMGMVRQLGAL
jgi:steroid delta-isomerase-like uncharacterized protein